MDTLFFIFHGSDSHSQKERLAKEKAKWGDPAMLDLNTTRLSSPLDFNKIQQATSTLPFLAKQRLVIVENYLNSNPPKNDLDKLIAYLPELPEFVRLFFMEERELSTKNKVLKVAQQSNKGKAHAFPKMKIDLLDTWIQKKVAALDGQINRQASRTLAQSVTAPDFYSKMRAKEKDHRTALLKHEIEKLVLFKGDQEITVADVQLLSPFVAEVNIFDLVDAVGNRSQKQATLLLQEKLQEGTEPFLLFSMIVRQFRLLIQVKTLALQGQRAPAISQNLRLHSFVAGKLFQQSQGFSMAQLEQIYRHLLEIDIGIKTGKQEIVTALHLFVAALTL
jgi:DNA polymerase-3 subunit delta